MIISAGIVIGAMYAVGSLLVNVFVPRESLTYAGGMVEIFTGMAQYFGLSRRWWAALSAWCCSSPCSAP